MMKKMSMPKYIREILDLLSANGFQAYVVGGAVRDFALGILPKDYDIATDATPQQVCALALSAGIRVIENLGQNFGVVLLIVHGQSVEVGTFRSEIYGSDAHRPERVRFCRELHEDLSRRDFTVNAMAVGLSGEIIDYYKGLADLDDKVLRTVGEPKKRFAEDALRMFRACRFCAQLDFTPDRQLTDALASECNRARGLSFARVKSELEKIILAPRVDTGLQMLVQSGLIAQSVVVRENGAKKSTPILPELKILPGKEQMWRQTLSALVFAKPDLSVRWSILLSYMSNINEDDGISSSKNILARFGYGEKFIRQIVWLLANRNDFTALMCAEGGAVDDWLKNQVRENIFHNTPALFTAVELLCDICLAEIAAQNDEDRLNACRETGRQIMDRAREMPVHTSDLQIKGHEAGRFLPEQEIGAFLRQALFLVQEGKLQNTRSDLLAILEDEVNEIPKM